MAIINRIDLFPEVIRPLHGERIVLDADYFESDETETGFIKITFNEPDEPDSAYRFAVTALKKYAERIIRADVPNFADAYDGWTVASASSVYREVPAFMLSEMTDKAEAERIAQGFVQEYAYATECLLHMSEQSELNAWLAKVRATL